jgi:hypothetical protein
MILATAFVPPQGTAIIDTLGGPLAPIARFAARGGKPFMVPRTWILTLRDRALSERSQRRSISAIGGVHTVIPIDACHDVMVSRPRRLAEILIERCRLRS